MTDELENMLAGTFIGLSKLLDEFHIDINGFCKVLKKYHIQNINESGYTITRLALRSGIDRRHVSSVINQEVKPHKPSIFKMIIDRIEQIASKNNGVINKKGSGSIEQIIKDVAPGATTIRSVVEELLVLGYIINMGDQVKFVMNPFNLTAQKSQALESISFALDHYITQAIHANNYGQK